MPAPAANPNVLNNPSPPVVPLTELTAEVGIFDLRDAIRYEGERFKYENWLGSSRNGIQRGWFKFLIATFPAVTERILEEKGREVVKGSLEYRALIHPQAPGGSIPQHTEISNNVMDALSLIAKNAGTSKESSFGDNNINVVDGHLPHRKAAEIRESLKQAINPLAVGGSKDVTAVNQTLVAMYAKYNLGPDSSRYARAMKRGDVLVIANTEKLQAQLDQHQTNIAAVNALLDQQNFKITTVASTLGPAGGRDALQKSLVGSVVERIPGISRVYALDLIVRAVGDVAFKTVRGVSVATLGGALVLNAVTNVAQEERYVEAQNAYAAASLSTEHTSYAGIQSRDLRRVAEATFHETVPDVLNPGTTKEGLYNAAQLIEQITAELRDLQAAPADAVKAASLAALYARAKARIAVGELDPKNKRRDLLDYGTNPAARIALRAHLDNVDAELTAIQVGGGRDWYTDVFTPQLATETNNLLTVIDPIRENASRQKTIVVAERAAVKTAALLAGFGLGHLLVGVVHLPTYIHINGQEGKAGIPGHDVVRLSNSPDAAKLSPKELQWIYETRNKPYDQLSQGDKVRLFNDLIRGRTGNQYDNIYNHPLQEPIYRGSDPMYSNEQRLWWSSNGPEAHMMTSDGSGAGFNPVDNMDHNQGIFDHIFSGHIGNQTYDNLHYVTQMIPHQNADGSVTSTASMPDFMRNLMYKDGAFGGNSVHASLFINGQENSLATAPNGLQQILNLDSVNEAFRQEVLHSLKVDHNVGEVIGTKGTEGYWKLIWGSVIGTSMEFPVTNALAILVAVYGPDTYFSRTVHYDDTPYNRTVNRVNVGVNRQPTPGANLDRMRQILQDPAIQRFLFSGNRAFNALSPREKDLVKNALGDVTAFIATLPPIRAYNGIQFLPPQPAPQLTQADYDTLRAVRSIINTRAVNPADQLFYDRLETQLANIEHAANQVRLMETVFLLGSASRVQFVPAGVGGSTLPAITIDPASLAMIPVNRIDNIIHSLNRINISNPIQLQQAAPLIIQLVRYVESKATSGTPVSLTTCQSIETFYDTYLDVILRSHAPITTAIGGVTVSNDQLRGTAKRLMRQVLEGRDLSIAGGFAIDLDHVEALTQSIFNNLSRTVPQPEYLDLIRMLELFHRNNIGSQASMAAGARHETIEPNIEAAINRINGIGTNNIDDGPIDYQLPRIPLPRLTAESILATTVSVQSANPIRFAYNNVAQFMELEHAIRAHIHPRIVNPTDPIPATGVTFDPGWEDIAMKYVNRLRGVRQAAAAGRPFNTFLLERREQLRVALAMP